MKVYLQNRVVLAEAETIADLEALIALQKAPKISKAAKARKRQNRKECDLCHKTFKGLTLHKKMKHKLVALKERDMRKMLARDHY